jgi:protein-S-isoprenylcysteine O-methyltransferase Ste14
MSSRRARDPQQQEGPDPLAEDKKLELQLTYAWGWFEYHAKQRLTAFHFFLILVGVLSVAFSRAVDGHWVPIAVALGGFGMLVSIAFFALDIRNEQLVDRGKDALKKLEVRLGVCLVDAHPPSGFKERIVRHALWFRLIQLAVAGGFAIAIVWALLDFPGAGSSQTPGR